MRILLLTITLSAFSVGLSAQDQQPQITPRDSQKVGATPEICLAVNYFGGGGTSVVPDADGVRMAYFVEVKVPHQGGGWDKRVRMFIRDIKLGSQANMVLEATDIQQVRWRPDGRHLTMIVSENGGPKRLVVFDTLENKMSPIEELPSKDVKDYSFDSQGDSLIFSVGDPMSTLGDELYRSNERSRRDGAPPSEINLKFPDKFKGFFDPKYLSLSPDGKIFTVRIRGWLKDIPIDWLSDEGLQKELAFGSLGVLPLAVVDTASGTVKNVFETPGASAESFWLPNTHEYFVPAASPVNTALSSRDLKDNRFMGADANMFFLDADSGSYQEVLREVDDHHQAPIGITANGDVLLFQGGATIVRMHRTGTKWQEVTRFDIPDDEHWRASYSGLWSDGKVVIGTFEAPDVPADIFIYKIGEKKVDKLSDLNPQLRDVWLAKPEKVEWSVPGGDGKPYKYTGILLKPKDYEPGKRYPLVIQTKGAQGWFLCDSGINHYPSFIPQMAASAGMMYLIRSAPVGYRQGDEVEAEPKGYPGQIRNLVQSMQQWEAAVDMLDKKGLVDPQKVGIIGFSATGWHVEYALAHSKFRYAAATASDNTQQGLFEYLVGWSKDNQISMNAVYGGPPYGDTLKNWLDYAVNFNLDKFHTPLLLETMGYGVKDDEGPYKLPVSIVIRNEVYNGLRALDKPVDAYYYSESSHEPDNADDRLLSMQRNLDWYRFWLQGYERASPEDPDQYKRWEHLRELQEADTAKLAVSRH